MFVVQLLAFRFAESGGFAIEKPGKAGSKAVNRKILLQEALKTGSVAMILE